MQELARLRAKAARLRPRTAADTDEALTFVDETLELTDAIRMDCAHLQHRCAELEQQIRAREAESRQLLDALPLAMVETDVDGTIVETNRAAAALLGRSKPKLKNELLLHFAEDRHTFAGLVRHLPYGGEPVTTTTRLRPRERAPFDAEITLMRDPREGDPRWLWFLDRVSAARTSRRTHVPASPAGLSSDQTAN